MILTTDAYDAIQSLKTIGLNRHQVAARTGISYPTVGKYWDMPKETFLKSQQDAENAKKIHQYKDDILYYLKRYPEISAAQLSAIICDKRDIKPDQLGVQPCTFQKYVTKLRKQYGIPKMPYTKVEPESSPAVPECKSILVKLEEKKAQVSEGKIIDLAARKTHSTNNHEL